MPVLVPVVGAALAASAATAGVAFTAATVLAIDIAANVIVYGGLAIASSLASSALARSLSPDQSNNAAPLSTLNAPATKVSVKQAAPYQRIIRGRQRVGGPIVLYRTAAGAGSKSKLIVQHVYSRRKVMGVTGVNLNGFKLSFAAGNPFGTILVPSPVEGQPYYPGYIRACFQSGTLNQPTNPLLRDIWPDLPTDWRLPGIANAVFEYEFGGDYDVHSALYGQTQLPAAEPEFDGCPVYDPRDPTQMLPSDPGDIDEWFAAQETWKLSYNAALHQADHLWQPDGLNAGPAGIDWDKVAAAADRADEVAATRDTATTGVYEKRYECHGVIGMDQRSADVFDGMLTASRATMIQGVDGLAWPSHDAPKQPVMTIRDDMIIGDVSFRGFKALGDLANKTTMEFVAPSRAYQVSEGPPLIRADLIAADGQELSLNVNLPFTASPSMAQRIAKADLNEVRIETTWAGVVDLRALGIREDDCVRIASRICPHWNGLYRVEEGQIVISLTGDSGVALKLTGYATATVTDWNAAVDDQPYEITDTDEVLAA